MTRYKLSNIRWETDYDGEALTELPTLVFMSSDQTLDELREGGAADWLSDKYGYLVISLDVDKAVDKEMFTVYIKRTETYYLPVNIRAYSRQEAENTVKKQDADDMFADIWNELQPDVKTEYSADHADEPERGEGPLA